MTTAFWPERAGCADLPSRPYLPFSANTTTSRITISKKVFTTSRIGTIASSLPLGAAKAGGASLGASTLGGSNFGASNLTAGAAAGAVACTVGIVTAGIVTAGIGGSGGAAGNAGAGAAEAGGGGGPLIAAFAAAPEIMRVNSPGPELAGGGAGIGVDWNVGSGGASFGACDNR